jgi:hypothetical protein
MLSSWRWNGARSLNNALHYSAPDGPLSPFRGQEVTVDAGARKVVIQELGRAEPSIEEWRRIIDDMGTFRVGSLVSSCYFCDKYPERL